jgi:hypothetical protein
MNLSDCLRRPLPTGGRPLKAIFQRPAPALDVPAAVLIAHRTTPAGTILTVRREHMRTHAGQIAFPAAGLILARTR